MRYSTDEQLQAIMLRKRQRQLRRSKRTTGILSGMTACLAVVSVAALSAFSGAGASAVFDSAYGAFLLSSRSGSYVLCGIIAFVCGSLVTFLCLREKQKQDADKAKKNAALQSELLEQHKTMSV